MKWIQTLSHHATLGSVQLVVDFLMFLFVVFGMRLVFLPSWLR